MRISDWSSDVCSSDLAPGFLRRRQQRRRAGQGRDDRRTRAAARQSALSLAGHPALLSIPSDDPRQARRDGRSEEHTSELQSLMRISYAVFCLKKKTNHKMTSEHHSRYLTLSNINTAIPCQ